MVAPPDATNFQELCEWLVLEAAFDALDVPYSVDVAYQSDEFSAVDVVWPVEVVTETCNILSPKWKDWAAVEARLQWPISHRLYTGGITVVAPTWLREAVIEEAVRVGLPVVSEALADRDG